MSVARPLLIAAALAAGCPVSAADPAPTAPPDQTAALTGLFRDLLLKSLPDPLVETGHGWGNQKDVVVGLKWHKLKPDPQRAPRNDGHWEKVRVVPVNTPQTLSLAVKNLATPEPGRTTFDAVVGLDVRLTYEHQLWKAGVRLWSGETQARCHVDLRLTCEVTSRTEAKPGSFFPAVFVRIRVTAADLTYRDLVCEHTAGMGGDAAEAIGKAVHGIIKKVKPDVERDMLAKANAAVVKAADTKEVRVEFDKLLSGKPPSVTRGQGK